MNAQMTEEAYQAQVYLSFASWCEINHFNGVADFLYKHSLEERNHMFKFLKYINNRGGAAHIAKIGAPPADPSDLGDCLRKTMQHEIDNSARINEIVDLALKERDWATFNFGQWFVKEQIEEESLISDVLDKYMVASSDLETGAGLYEFDRDIAGHGQEGDLPRDEALG